MNDDKMSKMTSTTLAWATRMLPFGMFNLISFIQNKRHQLSRKVILQNATAQYKLLEETVA